ncbi:GNAT family N-acetyltransferase [Hyphococcus luteus]|uniref:GNAT family N-acetyltransferase n=1 Tax=Hyphococcus luteus TaxID=2058213 RepID=A0A2S7KAH4_9PROT|nr:N-acetyltransferase [Marinicaulis flavus]PQA89478.1 GNAT family N-acetyltransferase [Marinicaulis flavus]
MSSGVAIRRADVLEAAALSELGAATFIETFGALYCPEDLQSFLKSAHAPSYYEEFMAKPETAAWLAEDDDGVILGYAMAGPCDLPVEAMPDGSGELKRLYLLKEAQGLGLGKALLETALAWLDAHFTHVYLGVFSENEKAQDLYRRYGFEKVGEYDFMVGNHADHEWIMKKNASKA